MINLVRPHDVLGENLMFDASRFDERTWYHFKNWFDNRRFIYHYRDNPTAFSMDYINKAFKPIISVMTGKVVRDQEFQFVNHFTQSDWLDVKYDDQHDQWVTFVNFKKECTD